MSKLAKLGGMAVGTAIGLGTVVGFEDAYMFAFGFISNFLAGHVNLENIETLNSSELLGAIGRMLTLGLVPVVIVWGLTEALNISMKLRRIVLSLLGILVLYAWFTVEGVTGTLIFMLLGPLIGFLFFATGPVLAFVMASLVMFVLSNHMLSFWTRNLTGLEDALLLAAQTVGTPIAWFYFSFFATLLVSVAVSLRLYRI